MTTTLDPERHWKPDATETNELPPAASAATMPDQGKAPGVAAVAAGSPAVCESELLQAIHGIEHDLGHCGYLRMHATKTFLPLVLAAARRHAESATVRQPQENARDVPTSGTNGEKNHE
jgi:hypothetical protein